MSLNELLLSPETMKAHRARWYAYSGPYGEKLPLKAGQRLYGIGYDVTCKCGWESRTGGGTRASVERALLSHRLDEQANASARSITCLHCGAEPGQPCQDSGPFSFKVLTYLHPERWEEDIRRTRENSGSAPVTHPVSAEYGHDQEAPRTVPAVPPAL